MSTARTSARCCSRCSSATCGRMIEDGRVFAAVPPLHRVIVHEPRHEAERDDLHLLARPSCTACSRSSTKSGKRYQEPDPALQGPGRDGCRPARHDHDGPRAPHAAPGARRGCRDAPASVFELLMGNDVAPRKEFIVELARDRARRARRIDAVTPAATVGTADAAARDQREPGRSSRSRRRAAARGIPLRAVASGSVRARRRPVADQRGRARPDPRQREPVLALEEARARARRRSRGPCAGNSSNARDLGAPGIGAGQRAGRRRDRDRPTTSLAASHRPPKKMTLALRRRG